MKSVDKEEIGKLYESLDFTSSYGDEFDPNVEQLKVEANQKCHNIEKMLSGTITYYKREKVKFFNNTNDMNSFESIKKLEEFLRPHLAQFSEFKD